MLQIIINNISLPIVAETLRIKKENSVFSNSFTISRSSKPFLVVDNEITRKALGVTNLYTLRTKVIQNAKVIDNEEQFDAEVTVIENVRGGIKCDLKYSSDALTHFPQKIHSYFNAIATNGGATSEHQEGVETDFDDTSYRGFVENHISRTFPAVDFNFPTLKYPRRQGELNEDDDWFKYRGEINNKTLGIVSLNSNINNNLINQNIVVPFYYLLAPLYKVFEGELNYNISGSFVDDKAIQKTLMYHEEDNLTAINQENNTIYRQWLTINPDRFLPDWTVAEYLNKLKNQFNVKIDIYNATKEIVLNYVEDIYFKTDILNITSYDFEDEYFPKYTSATNYLIQSSDSEDRINIGSDSITNNEPENETTVTLKTSFKEVPQTLTETWEDKNGIGLLYYDFQVDDVYNISIYENSSNRINHVFYGVAEKHWTNWFRMRLKAKEFPLQLKVSSKQKHDLENANKIYVFNQEFIIKDLEFEQIDNHFLIKLNLYSFNL